MAESKSDTSSDPSSGKNAKAPNVFDRMKEEFDAVLHNEKQKHEHHRRKETHGLRDDIDSNTEMTDVKAPNVFERAKEEIEAVVEAIHPKKEVPITHDSSSDGETRGSSMKPWEKSEVHSDIMAKEDAESRTHKVKPHHHKEFHGMSHDIDENTPISEVKGPSVFERAKEEIEAMVQTIHPKKESSVSPHKKKEGGLPVAIGKGLEKLCAPKGHHHDKD